MEFNIVQQLIVNLINEYDDYGYSLTSELLHKYEHEINKLMDDDEELK